MGRPGEGMTTSQALGTKRSNKKQNERFSITDINNQDFMKLLKNFRSSPYLGYKSKQVNNEQTEYFFFVIKQINKLMKARGVFDKTFLNRS